MFQYVLMTEKTIALGHKTVSEEERLEISIHAISGSRNSNDMRLLGRIGDCSVETLMDSRSTHNFLNPLMLRAAKLKVQREARL